MTHRRQLLTSLFVTTLAALALAPRVTWGADSDPPLRRELVGFEAHVLSLGFGNDVARTANVGLGGMLRVARQFWPNLYWTPIEAGVFVASDFHDEQIISGRILTEAGLVLRTSLGVFELGFGAGVGALGITTSHPPAQCDGTCNVGGKGAMLSPVARYLFRETGPLPFGLVLRGEVPLLPPDRDESFIGYLTGYGASVLAGIEVGYGGHAR